MSFENYGLSERKKLILKAIVDAYIKGGEPVGSKYLTQNNLIPFSSATIRNEMAELEDKGFLVQPHTSAGRVPSVSGYRFYVDSLLNSYEMTRNELNELNKLTKIKMAQMDKILESAGRLVGNVTNYTALTFKGKPNTTIILQYRTMRISDRRFILIMVTNAEIVKTQNINVSFDLSDDMLSRLEDVLNRYLSGISLDNVTLPLIIEIENSVGPDLSSLINPIIKSIYEATSEDGGELKFEGVNRLLQYPEYNDIEKFRNLLGLIEQKDDILNIVSKSKKDEINIYIGSESTVDIMDNSTLIFRTITSGENVVGAIGVIGPCRMDYSKVISTVDYLTRHIKDMVSGTKLLEDNGSEDNK